LIEDVDLSLKSYGFKGMDVFEGIVFWSTWSTLHGSSMEKLDAKKNLIKQYKHFDSY
jgi:hypothetical protein